MASTLQDFGILSAIWILASNDELPLITYEGIRFRLNLPANYDLKKLVREHGELFRLGGKLKALEDWKKAMLASTRQPSWIRTIQDDTTRIQRISSLTVDDVFRSQFRAAADADRSPVEILKWGLEHIDRMRKTQTEAREATAKTWQMWLVFGVGVANILVTIVAAILKGKS